MVDRFLSLFTEVRRGEGATALLLALNVFLILTAYSLIKPVREALILTDGGAELKSYLAAGQAVLLLGVVPVYGALASRLPRRRLINWVTSFFVACLAIFYFLGRLEVPLGVAFFIWIGIFNVMVVAQFWSFANDVYTTNEGSRLFPIVQFGASAGATVGAFLAGRLIAPFGLFPLMLVAGVLLLVAVVLTNVVDTRERRRRETGIPDMYTSMVMPAATLTDIATGDTAEHAARDTEENEDQEVTSQEEEVTAASDRMSSGGAFQLVFRNRYLLLIALLLMLLNWVNTTGEFILGRAVTEAAERAALGGELGGLTRGEFIGAFYSNFNAIVNLVGMLIQLFVVSRVFKYFGVRVAIMVLPVIAFAGYAILAFYPILAVVRWAKTAENATDYSLQKTASQALFLPTTREEKYKAKQAIDAFFWRAGDVLSALLVYVGTSLLALKTGQFALVNLGLVSVWLILAFFVGRRYGVLAAE